MVRTGVVIVVVPPPVNSKIKTSPAPAALTKVTKPAALVAVVLVML